MSIEEKRTWIMGAVALVAYCLYLATVLPRAAATSLATMDYVGPLLWSIGGAIIAAIVLNLVNVIYLGFVLSALLESVSKIVAYRRGFVGW